MAATKNETKPTLLDSLLREASGRILHAMALPKAKAKTEWPLAASCERDVACLLEAEKREHEAAVHYVSAASCYARAQDYLHAVQHLRAALSFSLREAHRRDVERLLKEWLPKAKRQIRKQARKQPVPVA